MVDEKSIINLDLCVPKSLDDYFINMDVIKKFKNLLIDREIFNLILYGKEGTGKYTIVLCYLSDIFGKSVFNVKNIEYVLHDSINKKNSIINLFNKSH